MIGLCICYYNRNYGSMLQAYATVAEIEKRNIQYQIIGYRKKITPIFLVRNATRVFNKVWRNEKKLKIQKNINSIIHDDYKKGSCARNKVFDDFKEKYFEDKVKVCFGYNELQEKASNYSKVLVGSDQMWSPSGLTTNFYNLMFVPENIDKISYATSFGVASIPKYQRSKTKEFLERLQYISVRENSGYEIIKELTGKKAVVAVDPTMLLSREEWDLFSGEVPIYNQKYIFAYFLGNNQEHRKCVNELKKRTGYKIVALKHLDEYVPGDETFGDYTPYEIGPCEFLNLLKNAEYVCTDSFHGTVFSSLFHKQFITFSRYPDSASVSKNSRITSLLENLGLESRHFVSGNILENIQKNIDYDKVDERRKRMIQDSKEFLDNALGS